MSCTWIAGRSPDLRRDVSKVRRVVSHRGIQLAIFFCLLLLRSYPRLFHPQVWDEDATANIFGFLNFGSASLLKPVNGYLLLLPKAISLLSLSVSFSYYPLLSTLLTWAAILVMLIVIASPKTQLRGGILLSILVLLVPSDTEVFGLPLYTFWWATLLLFVVILWEKNSVDLKWRLPIVFVAGLSSPVIVGVASIFLLRIAAYRKVWQEWVVSLTAILCAVLQFLVWKSSPVEFYPSNPVTATKIGQIIPKFLGRYLIGNLLPRSGGLWIAGVGLLAFLIITLLRHWQSFSFWCIAALLVISIAMVARRVDISILHPVHAGPRYFFFPFVLISWWAAQTALCDRSRYFRILGAGVILLSVANAAPIPTRHHADLHWKQHVLSCPFFDRYSIPIEFDGHAERTWYLYITGAQCRALLNRDWFGKVPARALTFPYSVLPYDSAESPASLATPQSVVNSDWVSAPPAWDNPLKRVVAITSFEPSRAGGSRVTLQLRKGQTLWYRSSPLTQRFNLLINNGKSPFLQTLPPALIWTLLSFSNSTLPDQFSVTFAGSDGSTEWAVLGLARKE